MTAGTTLNVWRRWREVERQDATYRVVVLSSYTADPVVPHLGLALHDGGLPARLIVGPYNQIVQQCVDPGSATAATEPDIVFVVPRFEECWNQFPAPGDLPAADYAAELLLLADEAVAACARWNAILVFVLPALPEQRLLGVGDCGMRRGTVATATAVREALRDRLAGRPGVGLLDAEAVVRSLGSANAHTPVLERLAKIPYSDGFFAGLADQAARLLRLWFRPAQPCAVLDMDTLVCTEGGLRPGAELLRPVVDQFRAAGVGVIAVSNEQPDLVWPRLRSLFGDEWEELADDWQFAGDSRLPESAGASVLTADPERWPDGAGVVDVGEEPELWASKLIGSTVWDQVPPPDSPRASEVSAATPSAPMSLARYIAGLGVSVDWQPVDNDLVPSVTEMAEKTKDFTLGLDHDQHSLTALVADGTGLVLVGEVRDRLGKYGHAVVFGARFANGCCVVDPFYVSCPAMGKGVEDVALDRIMRLAADHHCNRLVFRFVPTGRNDAALRFLRNIPEAGSVRVIVEESSSQVAAAAAT